MVSGTKGHFSFFFKGFVYLLEELHYGRKAFQIFLGLVFLKSLLALYLPEFIATKIRAPRE